MKTLSNKSGFTLIVTFLLCNSYSILFGTSCGRDLWIAYIIASFITVILWLLLSFVYEKGGFSSFFHMMDFAFGKSFAVCIIFFLLVYAILSCTTSVSLFSRFTQLTALSKTPQIVLPLLILVLSAIALKSGISVLSEGVTLIFYFSILTFICFIFFGIPQLDIKSALPIFENGFLPVAKSSLSIFANQFGDIILLFCIYSNIKENPKRRKVTLWAVIIGCAFYSVIALFTLLTLGVEQINNEYFPVFTILSIRNIGSYIQHMEILTSIAMTFSVFIRQTIGLYFASEAIAHIFKKESGKPFLIPLSLIIPAGGQLLYWNMMSLRARLDGNLNLYILLPLQLLLPCLLAIFAIIKKKNREVK